MRTGSHLLPSARRGDTAGLDVHPPKIETFDVPAMANVDPKGYVRAVDKYRVEPFGLYLARPVVDRVDLAYRESWLLPDLDLVVTDWTCHPGHQRDHDRYLDIALVRPGERTWQLVDLYVDIELRTGEGLTVLDTDELLGALGEGLINRVTTQRALDATYRTVESLAAHGYDLGAWLSGLGIELTWRRHPA
jgi:predicted RNA-binding protein associated with RNAse of E/G family